MIKPIAHNMLKMIQCSTEKRATLPREALVSLFGQSLIVLSILWKMCVSYPEYEKCNFVLDFFIDIVDFDWNWCCAGHGLKIIIQYLITMDILTINEDILYVIEYINIHCFDLNWLLCFYTYLIDIKYWVLIILFTFHYFKI